MKIILLVFLLSIEMNIHAISQNTPFVFDKDKISVGTLEIYEFAYNKEEYQPMYKTYLYYITINDLELITFSMKSSKPLYFKKIKMNWDYMMEERSDFIYLVDINKFEVGNVLSWSHVVDFLKQTSTTTYIRKAKSGTEKEISVVKLQNYPAYFYMKDDLLSLSLSLRFFPLEREKITVEHYVKKYSHPVEIKYIGKEFVEARYGKVMCYKFELIPKLSLFMKLITDVRDAYMWIDSENQTYSMVKYVNNNMRDGSTQKVEYRLAEIKKLSQQEWNIFKVEKGIDIK